MPLPLSLMLLEGDDQVDALERGTSFTTMTRAGSTVWPANQAALLIDLTLDEPPLITEIGSLTRSRQRIATGWHRLRYVRRTTLDQPIAVDQLLNALPTRSREATEERLRRGGVLPIGTARAVVELVEKLSPVAGRELRQLIGQGEPVRLTDSGLQAAAQEADAVRLALDIARIPRTELRDVRPDGSSSFLERLDLVRASEDTTIAYDGMRFLDFERIENPSGVVVFRKGREQLTVINVNRQPLERTTGADLIYINEWLESFVLVQYKTMRREREDTSRLVYRPDAQLGLELERMRRFKAAPDDRSPASFRLSTATCFLKLCRQVTTLDRAQDLVSGMYLPLDYYDVLAASPDVRGSRGGVVLGYDTIHRYVSNDLFVGLVRGGWVGSRGAATKELEMLVLSGLDAGHSVTVAAAARGALADTPG
jgi:hypothetical protein